MSDTLDTLYGALDRLDELTDPVRLNRDEDDLDAYQYALDKMAESAMEKDALGEAHRFRNLRTRMEHAQERDESVEIPRSDALRLSATLHAFHDKFLANDDAISAADMEQTIDAIDGKLEQKATETEKGT